MGDLLIPTDRVITLEAREVLDEFMQLHCRVELRDLVERALRARIAQMASRYVSLHEDRWGLVGRLSLLMPVPVWKPSELRPQLYG